MTKRRYITLFFLLFAMPFSWAQQGKNVRGVVVDKDSKFPIAGASVVVLGSNPFIGVATEENGGFLLSNVPLGRASIKVSFIGYKDAFANDVLVIAGKETQLNIELEEKVNEVKEVVVSTENKSRPKNEFAVVSAQSFDVEQTNKFSGSRNDPARMASNFAGVSGANDARNDIIIRGNSPMGLLWRLEGIDIPSPNHFAGFGSTGGPVSMLNNNTLAKSDFMTSAFPAEYGNANSGVFDLKMRNGNKTKHEFLAQLGFNGIELGAEGPFSKKKSQASFLINYRYSTLALFKLLKANFGTGTAVPEYQDLTFKVDVPTKKAGVFRFWGLGGLSKIDLLGSPNNNGNSMYGNSNQNLYNKVQTGMLGFSHTYFFNSKSYLRVSLGASHQRQRATIDTINVIDRSIVAPFEKADLRQNKYSTHLFYNHKMNTRNTIGTGFIGTVFDVKFLTDVSYNGNLVPVKSGKGYSGLLEYYAMWQHKFSDRLVLNTGFHIQYFSLSRSVSPPEPRVGLRYQLNEKQFISFGYGMHHQIQPLPTYYNYEIGTGNQQPTNRDMGFTRSNHVVFGYDLTFSKDFHMKVESYFQYIDKAPVSDTVSSFSMLNAGSDFSTPGNNNLKNKGVGMNYGLELTMEKFFTKGYYFLTTISVFQSRYKGSDNMWRNTAFNGGFVANTLGGYEYKFGGRKNKAKRNAVAIDGKFTLAGGRYYTPIDVAQSVIQRMPIEIGRQAFSEQYPVYFRPDIKFSYRLSMKKITQEFSIDIQNFINRKNVFRITYDVSTNEKVIQYQQGIFILPQYRIYF